MAPISTTFGFLSLLFSIFTVSAAQPARHRVHPRYLHTPRGINVDHVHRHVARPMIAKDDTLYSEYKSKLALRHAALSIFERIESAEILRRDQNVRQDDTAALQEKIDELETAFQSLIALLAADYGVTFGSSQSSSSVISLPTLTSPLLPGSIIAATTSMDSSEATSTDEPNPSTAVSSTSQSQITPSTEASSTSHTFDPLSSSNVAVYYGQTDQTSAVPLTSVCADPSVDIVVLAFLNHFFTPYPTSTYPTLNMGPHCWAASSAQVSAGATGLIDCVSDGFAELVRTCQTQYGKKVLLSLGGAIGYSDTQIPSDAAANSLADTIWDLFLGGSGLESIRPFGDVILDGIDIDNEDPANAAHLPVLISSLRQDFANARDIKPYFLSAAPQCPRPDQSIPLESMQTQIDFVWPQFYNNPECNLDSEGFIASLQAWAGDLSGTEQEMFGNINMGGFVNIGNGVSSPRLLVGAPAFAAAGSGFLEGEPFLEVLSQVKNTNLGGRFDGLSPLGGFMFWDGAYGEESERVDGVGASYMQAVKDVLGGG
jgi:chitinase